MKMKMLLSAAFMAFGGLSSPAWAHAQLSKASPSVGSVVATSPSEIKLTFTEGVEPSFSGMDVTRANGDKAPIGSIQVDGSDMVVAVKQPLPPGVYRVMWHVTSIDSHRTQGSFTFEVKP
jgi:methionine-rich copper-binding protein CopC